MIFKDILINKYNVFIFIKYFCIFLLTYKLNDLIKTNKSKLLFKFYYIFYFILYFFIKVYYSYNSIYII